MDEDQHPSPCGAATYVECSRGAKEGMEMRKGIFVGLVLFGLFWVVGWSQGQSIPPGTATPGRAAASAADGEIIGSIGGGGAIARSGDAGRGGGGAGC